MSTKNEAVLKTLLESFNASVTELAVAERITKRVLGELSRSALELYLDYGVVQPINSLMGKHEHDDKKVTFVLTPANWKMAANYFTSFIPHLYNSDEVNKYIDGSSNKRVPLVFGKKDNKRAGKVITFDYDVHKSVMDCEAVKAGLKDKSISPKEVVTRIITKWLDDVNNNIWTFIAATDMSDGKQKDFGLELDKLLTKALNPETEGGITAEAAMDIIGKHINLKDVLTKINADK